MRHNIRPLIGAVTLTLFLLAGGFSIGRIPGVRETGIHFVDHVAYWLVVPWLAYCGASLRASGTVSSPTRIVGGVSLAIVYVVVAFSSLRSPLAAEAHLSGLDVILYTAGLIGLLLLPGAELRLLAQALPVALLAAALAYAVAGLVSIDPRDPGRVAAFGGGWNIFARVVGVGILVLTYLHRVKQGQGWLHIGIGAVLAIALIMSGSRGGILAVLIALLSGLIPIRIGRASPRRIAKSLPTFILAVALATGSFLAFETLSSFVIDRFVQQTVLEGYTSRREELIFRGLEMLEQKPATGWGLSSFSVVSGTQQPYVHVFVIDLAVAVGVFPALGWSAIMLAILAINARRRDRTSLDRLFFQILILYLVADCFSGGIADSRNSAFFALVALEPLRGSSAKMSEG